RAGCDCLVSAGHLLARQLAGELAVSPVGAGRNDQARGAPVQPVDDARARLAARRRPDAAPPQKRVDKGPGEVTGGRVHHHPRGLVDDQQVLVLVEHRQRDLLRSRAKVGGRGQAELYNIARPNLVGGPGRIPVDEDRALAGQSPRRRACQLRGLLAQETVEAAGRSARPQPGEGRLRNRYPTASRTTPTEIAESATLKVGHQCSAMKSVTDPW